MGGFLGIGGSSQKTDRSLELTGFNQLKNVFNYAMPTGQNLLSGATAGLGQAKNYFSKILSGNRATVAQTMAPEINAVTSASDAAKRQAEASGTARGGGVSGAMQQRKDVTEGRISDAIFKARPAAAEELGKLSEAELANATNVLGLGANTAANITSLASSSRVNSQAINSAVQQQVGGAIEAALMLA